MKSLTSRLKQGAKSIASSIGLSEHRYHQLFSSLDSDHDHQLVKADIINWLLDELFINNPYWEAQQTASASSDELFDKVWNRLDRQGKGFITYEDWSDAMKGKKEKEVEESARSVIQVTKERKEKAIRKIFDAIDVNGNGDLDFDSVNAWLKYDAAYWAQQGLPSNFASEEQRQLLFDQLDRDQDGCVTFDDLNAYLQNWSIRELRVRTSAMRQDSETRKMKRMAELLAATMASRLGLGGDNGGDAGTSTRTRPRSVSDMASAPNSALSASGISSAGATSIITASGVGSSKRKPKPTKSHIQRQIDELVLQCLALAAESSEINAKRRKLNAANEKLDKQLVHCERERMKLITKMTEMEQEIKETTEAQGQAQTQPQQQQPSQETVQQRLQYINQRYPQVIIDITNTEASVKALQAQRDVLTATFSPLAHKQADVQKQLAQTEATLPVAEAFIAQTKATTVNVEAVLATVPTPSPTSADIDTRVNIDSEKLRIERQLQDLQETVAAVEANRDSITHDQTLLKQDLQETKEQITEKQIAMTNVHELLTAAENKLAALQKEKEALEKEKATLSSNPTTPTTPGTISGSSTTAGSSSTSGTMIRSKSGTDLTAQLAKNAEILAAINNDRETMSIQLREMEAEHNVLTRRHLEISTQLTNLNQQISILFDGQLYERRNSFGETPADSTLPGGVHLDALPVPCVASVECEFEGKKTSGLLNVSNYILMYESKIGHYVGRGLYSISPDQDRSPPSASSGLSSAAAAALAQRRRSSVIPGGLSSFNDTRFCVDISDVVSVKFIHTNDDDGHEEEGYEDEGVSELENSLKEPSIATIIIQLRVGYHNRFLMNETIDEDGVGVAGVAPASGGGPNRSPPLPPRHTYSQSTSVATHPNVPTSSSASGSPAPSPPNVSSPPTASLSQPSSPRTVTIACYGDYDSLKRIDKSLRLFMSLYESKVSHQAFRRRAASVQVTTSNTTEYLDEKIAEYRKQRGLPPVAPKQGDSGVINTSGQPAISDIIVNGFSEITSLQNLKKILLTSPPRLHEHPWRLAYSITQHGASFPYFFRVLSDSPQSIMLFQTAGGRIFGGYCASPWENRIHSVAATSPDTATGSYYSTKDCFVLTLRPNGDLHANGHTEQHQLQQQALAQQGGVRSDKKETMSDPTGLAQPALAHTSSEPLSPTAVPHESLLTPADSASSVVIDTMLKATHAVEAASAAGLAVAPAVRRASIDTSSASATSAANSSSASSSPITDVPHLASTLRLYHATGRNNCYMYSSPDCIGMGGDAQQSAAPTSFAWSVDRDFREGMSNPCETYGNPMLTEEQNWSCSALEVWVPALNIGYRKDGLSLPAAAASTTESLAVEQVPAFINISVTPPQSVSPPQVSSPTPQQQQLSSRRTIS